MQGADHEIRVVASLLDRLIDQEPKSTRDVLPTRAQTVRALRDAVQRDLDELLNTRNSFADLSADFVEAGQSVLTYGLPDFSALAGRDRNRLRQMLESAIRTFEPRLTGVSATIIATERPDRAPSLREPIRIRIEARLVMDPSPEAVAFDVMMPVTNGSIEVRERE